MVTQAQTLVIPPGDQTAKEGKASFGPLVGLTPKLHCQPLHFIPFPDLSRHPLPELRPQQEEEVGWELGTN